MRFSYMVNRKTDACGKYHSGKAEKGFVNGIKFSTKEKIVTRATVELAYKKELEVQKKEGGVNDPKKIDVRGGSYLYSIFLRFGVIMKENKPSVLIQLFNCIDPLSEKYMPIRIDSSLI